MRADEQTDTHARHNTPIPTGDGIKINATNQKYSVKFSGDSKGKLCLTAPPPSKERRKFRTRNPPAFATLQSPTTTNLCACGSESASARVPHTASPWRRTPSTTTLFFAVAAAAASPAHAGSTYRIPSHSVRLGRRMECACRLLTLAVDSLRMHPLRGLSRLCFKSQTIGYNVRRQAMFTSPVKLAFHDADTDTVILARVFADTFDTRDWAHSMGP